MVFLLLRETGKNQFARSKKSRHNFDIFLTVAIALARDLSSLSYRWFFFASVKGMETWYKTQKALKGMKVSVFQNYWKFIFSFFIFFCIASSVFEKTWRKYGVGYFLSLYFGNLKKLWRGLNVVSAWRPISHYSDCKKSKTFPQCRENWSVYIRISNQFLRMIEWKKKWFFLLHFLLTQLKPAH